ncbi:MAG TPA: thioredoxin domain-containing protein [Patescibacteria group bacterium]
MTEEEKKIDEASAEEEQMKGTSNEPETEQVEDKDKKIKNLISAVILLAGLFVGSLFVDVVQMVRGGGFSQHALNSTDVFASNGKTWVAYADPIVKVQVLTDDSCGDACKPDDVLVALKQALPTMLSSKVDAKSQQGKKLAQEFGIKTLPAFVFSNDIEKTDLFAKAQPFLQKGDDGYVINSAQAGFPVGKYIAAPAIGDKDIKVGADDAAVKVVAFSDFANPQDAQLWQSTVSQILKDYEGKIQFVFKNYFAQGSTVSQGAALAGECANDQGKFTDYATKLFANQKAWSTQKDATAILEGYAAQIGLKSADFNKCLTSKADQAQVTQNLKDGQDFGLQATPSMFIGSDLQQPNVKYDDVKTALDTQLNK